MTNFIHPCPGSRLTSAFGNRTIAGKKEWHQGIDLAKPGTVPIKAAAAGTIIRAGVLGSYGNVVIIQHSISGKRMDTTYAHLKSISVKNGDKVKQGQQIGLMGNTGRSTGQHLHFEIHNGAWATGQPNAVDPYPYINGATTTLYLPKTASSWAIYPLNKQPIKANAIARLNPAKFGGLSYTVLGTPQPNVYTIETKQFGKVNIYAGKETGAIIK